MAQNMRNGAKTHIRPSLVDMACVGGKCTSMGHEVLKMLVASRIPGAGRGTSITANVMTFGS